MTKPESQNCSARVSLGIIRFKAPHFQVKKLKLSENLSLASHKTSEQLRALIPGSR